ncbi:hypothetical protein QEH56_21450 [Pelagicoccus enzymogenes]|nr:hypothetical protein [Pelagicoccus enzymogenes]
MQLDPIHIQPSEVTERRDPLLSVSKNLTAADFQIYLEQAGAVGGISPDPVGAGAEKPLSLKEEYFALLPDLEGVDFRPPVSGFDLGLELNRLAKVELKVEAMEEAGEIDDALDAFIGIHGLKDRLSRAEKAELRERFKELTRAALLEDEWKNAYLGAMKKRIDVSIEGLREFLLGDEGKVRMVDVGAETPYGDPDLMSFIRDSKWNNFNPPDFALIAKADQMLLEARRSRERDARQRVSF